MTISDAEQAGQLIAFGLRPKLQPSRDVDYQRLIRRYGEDDVFAAHVRAFANGMGLKVLTVDKEGGAVLATETDSVFETRMEDYAKYLAGKERRDSQKVLHGIAHLAIAALSFPRADDLADDTYVGRVSVEQVDIVVRETCRLLEERAARSGDKYEQSATESELERSWQVYQRRPAVTSTKDDRANATATRQIIRRALKYLTERGLMDEVGEVHDEVYRPTYRYRIHVRELASHTAFLELLELGAVPSMTATTMTATTGSVGE